MERFLMAATIKCPHCEEEIASRATKCPYCTGNIKRGDGSGFLYNTLGSAILFFVVSLFFDGNSWADCFAWGGLGLLLGPVFWIYNAFIKPSKA